MPSPFETAQSLLIRSQCRNPTWTEQATFNAVPTSAAAGVACNNSPAAVVCVDLRENVAHRTCYLEVSTVDLGATYTVTIDGNNVAYNGSSEAPADLDELLAGIADAINDDGTVSAIVAATVTSDDKIKLVGVGEDDYTLELTTTGTGVIDAEVDATAGTWAVYGLPVQGTNSAALAAEGKIARWRLLYGATGSCDFRGFLERISTGGLASVAVHLEATAPDDVANGDNSITPTATVLVGTGENE